jgi:hypothetical protein
MILIFLLVVVVASAAAVIAGYALGIFDRFLESGTANPFPQILLPVKTDTSAPDVASPTVGLNVTLLPETTPSTTPQVLSPTVSPSPTNVLTTPTQTPTQQPTAHPDICAQFDLRFHQATSSMIAWRLQNNSGQEFVLESIEIDWPSANDAMFNAFLDGKVIWGGEELAPPSRIENWIGERIDRSVSGLSRLELFFGVEAAESGYSLTLRFENGCEATASQ